MYFYHDTCASGLALCSRSQEPGNLSRCPLDSDPCLSRGQGRGGWSFTQWRSPGLDFIRLCKDEVCLRTFRQHLPWQFHGFIDTKEHCHFMKVTLQRGGLTTGKRPRYLLGENWKPLCWAAQVVKNIDGHGMPLSSRRLSKSDRHALYLEKWNIGPVVPSSALKPHILKENHKSSYDSDELVFTADQALTPRPQWPAAGRECFHKVPPWSEVILRSRNQRHNEIPSQSWTQYRNRPLTCFCVTSPSPSKSSCHLCTSYSVSPSPSSLQTEECGTPMCSSILAF